MASALILPSGWHAPHIVRPVSILFIMMEATDSKTSTAAPVVSVADHGSETNTHFFNSQLDSESSLNHDMHTTSANSSNKISDLLDNVDNAINTSKKKLSPPTQKRTVSASHRRRHRNFHQMESISETTGCFGDAADNFESIFISTRHTTHTVNSNDTVSNASTSSSSSFSSARRRRSNPTSSVGSSVGSGSGPTSRRRLSHNMTNNQVSGHDENAHDVQRRIENTSGLSASLDAGMKSLRKWIRSRKFASNPFAGSDSGQSTMRLGEEDISALYRAGNDTVPPTTTASSASGDSSLNLFEHGGSSGFLYYRPYEVHVRHGVDDGLVYGSDTDESTDLLFPLVNLSEEGGLRHRAHSEPDRAQVNGFFFGSVYSSRAIDTGGARDDSSTPVRRNTVSHVNVTDVTVSTIEEGNATTHLEPEQMEYVPRSQTPTVPTVDIVTENIVAESPVSFQSTALSESANDGNTDNSVIETFVDPERDARTRWLQINRRFRCVMSSVALTFSFLLVLYLISWVILIATYVLSLTKTCDVPLKAYFWLATLQLAMDFFRAEIMKLMCRWRSDSRGGVPLRVLLYNVAYLIYAMLVLRLGIMSVFVRESTCYDTAPELFLASAVFVSLTLLAWTLIIVGYIIPYATVAVLLTRNGYFPNEDLDAVDGVEGNRRGRLIGILPNNLANPAPPECIEKLRVVMYGEVNDSFQKKECCICLMEYEPGDGIVATPCDHIFHKQCCKEWLQLSRSCPICRRDIVEGLGEGTTLEDLSSSDPGSHRINNPEARRSSRGWQREASNLLRFLRRHQRSPTPAENSSNGN